LKHGSQINNFGDQEYVASAFLCGRLLTADQEMAKVMTMFKTGGLWLGEILWIDREKDLSCQIHRALA
jgi:hypothetical protein